MQFEFYEEKYFQNTQRGRFPKDWHVVRFSDVISLEYGKGLPERERAQGKYLVVGSNGIVGYHDRALVKGPGIVVGRKGTIGAITWIDSDFWPIDTTFFVKFKTDDIFLRWLFYELIYLNLSSLSLADVVPGLKRELVYSLVIPLPPLNEQRCIVDILSVFDEAIQKANEVIAKTERLKKGLMQELLTKGIGHKEFKCSKELDCEIPKEWQVVSLGTIVKVQGGFAFKSVDYVEKGVPLIRIANVSFGRVELKDLAKLPHSYLDKYRDFSLEENDIVIVLTRPIIEGGIKAAKIEKNHTPALLNQRVGRFRTTDKSQIVSDFLFHVIFSNNFIKQVEKGLVTMNQPNISPYEMEKFKIPLPPPSEQEKIAESVSTVDKKLELERNEKAKLERIKQGLMDLLLTGKIRVKVD